MALKKKVAKPNAAIDPAPTPIIEAKSPLSKRRISKKPKVQEAVPEPKPQENSVAKRGLFGAPIVSPPKQELPKTEVKSQEPEKIDRSKNRERQKKNPIKESTDAKRPGSEKPSKPKANAKKVRDSADAPSAVDLELPVPVWRPVSKAPSRQIEKKADPQAADVTTQDDSQLAPRRSRSRRRREHRQMDISAGAVLSSPETVPAPPQQRKERPQRREVKKKVEVVVPELRPTREIIPTPPDAPQIVVRDGVPILVRDHKAIPPVVFFGSSLDEKRAATVLEEIKRAGESGVHLFSHLIELTVDLSMVDDAVAFAGYLINKTLEVDPESQTILRVVFSAPDGWEQKFPKAKYIMPGGGTAEPSFCDDTFWTVAQDCLTDFIQKLRKLDNSKAVIGIHLERGEWFFAAGAGYDTSPSALEKFRDWVKMRYRDDVVALRAAWFDGGAQFGTIAIPPYEKMTGVDHEQFVRTGRKARRWVDYHLFLSDSTVERIGHLAHAVKKASDGYFVVCVDYGYTFEWSHPANGHLSLGKLLRNPEVDIICGPPSYKNREPGGSAPFTCPIDSFALNGKLYLSEEDFKTPISERIEPDDYNPVMKTPQALESVHWRGVGAALAHMSGISWMDTWGNGWLNTPAIWERGNEVRKILEKRIGAPSVDPDVAVFIDERSLAYLVDERAFNMLVQSVRESVLRCGMSAGFYLLSDLAHRENFPECRLHVFVNAWDIRPEVRSAIKSRLQGKDKVLFWLYAAGLFDGGRESLERVREATGIALKPQPFASRSGSTLLNRKNPLCDALPEGLVAAGSELEPSYFAIPEESLVLGEYSQTGLPSYVLREFHGEDADQRWRSVFLGEPLVTPALIRALGELSGAHVWSFQDDVVHVRPPFLTIHCTGAGTRTITLPNKWSAYNIASGEWSALESTHLKFQATDGSTHLFLVGSRQEIETMLETPDSDYMHIAEIPPRKENTLHLDSILFDVPIMKLGEWVEESWTDTMADDLLIKPSMLDMEPLDEADNASNLPRHRRRRSGRRRGGGSEETSDSRREGNDRVPSVADLEVNVVFRKRE